MLLFARLLWLGDVRHGSVSVCVCVYLRPASAIGWSYKKNGKFIFGIIIVIQRDSVKNRIEFLWTPVPNHTHPLRAHSRCCSILCSSAAFRLSCEHFSSAQVKTTFSDAKASLRTEKLKVNGEAIESFSIVIIGFGARRLDSVAASKQPQGNRIH